MEWSVLDEEIERNGAIFKSTQLAIRSSLWEAVGMAEKRTKAGKEQRQADQLDKKSERRPQQGTHIKDRKCTVIS